MTVYTKTPAEVCAPTTSGGAARGADMGDMQILLTEIVAQIEASVEGVIWKSAVDLATTANITLSGEQTIDGTLTSTSRVLVKSQTLPAQNGVYVTAAGAWARATDADSEAELHRAGYYVKAGTANGGKQFACTTDLPITVGTTGLTFVQIGDAGDTSLTAEDVGLDQVGNYTPANQVKEGINGATAKTTPADADLVGLLDSAASFALKKLTWANLKAAVWTAIGPLISGGTAKTTPVDGDLFAIADSAALNVSKKLSWANIKTTLFGDQVFTDIDDAIFEQTVTHVPGYDSDEPGSFVDVSADGYILQSQLMEEEYDTDEEEPVAAISLDGYALDEIGLIPALPAMVNADQIRRLRQKLRMILRDSTQVCRISTIGDSWFASYLPVLLRDRLVAIYGDAGPGFVNVADSNNNKSADSRISVAKSGTWTDVIGFEPMPSTTAMETSDTGAYITVFGVGAIATAWLHFVAAGGATGFYRWGVYDGSGSTTDRTNYVFGSDHSLDLSTGYKIAMLTDAPASGTWALEFGRSAGTIKVGGVDLRSGTGGVIVDTLAKGGSNTGFWLIPDKDDWQTAYGSLDSDGTFVMLGTNDQAGVVTNLQISRNLDALRQRLVAAEPAQDVIYISPCENFLGRARLIKDITAAVRAIALQTGTPHLDLQPAFGPLSKMADYRSTGVRPLFNVDDVHPDSFTGMVVIADQIERLLIQ